MRWLNLVPLVASLALIGAGPAERTRQELDTLKSTIEEGQARAKAIEDKEKANAAAAQVLQNDLVRLADEAQSRESAIQVLTPEIDALSAKRAAARQELDQRMDALTHSLAAIERIERRPPAAMLARPGAAIDRARASDLLSTLVPHLAADAEELKQRLGEIDELESALVKRRTSLEAARGELAKARRGIDAALAKRQAERQVLEDALSKEKTRLERAAREARDLEGLLARLENESKRAKAEADEALPKVSAQALAAIAGRLPARGAIVKAFGQVDAAGARADGLTIQASAHAQVTTPVKGRVAFAGPFKGYGQLLIVAAPGGYHVLLAGLDRLYAEMGDDLKGGEPIGELGEEGVSSRLYLEVRAHGKPVDPLPYLAAHDVKVTG